jgi:hypothetical protein
VVKGDQSMNVDEHWDRIKEIAVVWDRTGYKSDGEKLYRLMIDLLSTPEGRARVEAGLNEPLKKAMRIVRSLCSILDRNRDGIPGLSEGDRHRLLELGTDASRKAAAKEEGS